MQYNTALGFLLSGVGLIALIKKRSIIATVFGTVVCLLGFLTLFEYVARVDLGIDQFFMEHDILTKTSHPGRMAPNTALCFFLYGLSLTLARAQKPVLISVGFTVLLLSFLSFIGYLTEVESIYGWGTLTRMAIHTAMGFVILSAGLIYFGILTLKEKKTDFWEYTPFTLLSIVIVMTLFAWYGIRESAQARNREYINMLIEDTKDNLKDRYTLYEQSLLGGLGLFYASDSVERLEWRNYTKALNIKETLTGTNGIGYIASVPEEELEEYLQSVREDGAPSFKNHPDTDYTDKFIITFIEPEEFNNKAVGLDIGFEANRREAAERSRDYGVPALTKKIELVQDDKKLPGFLLLIPVYDVKEIPITIKERRAHFVGWVYAPFIGANFLQGLEEARRGQLGFHVYDGEEIKPEALIYSTLTDLEEAQGLVSTYDRQSTIELAGRVWTFKWKPTSKIDLPGNKNLANIILGLGFFLAGLLYITLLRLLHGKRIIAREVEKQTAQLTEAKSFQDLMMNTIPDLVFVKDEEFRIVQANGAFLNIYPETKRGSVIGTTTLEEYAPDEVAIFTKNDRLAFEKGYHETKEEITFPNGTTRTLFTKKIRFSNNNEYYILGISRDITEIIKTQEELERVNDELEKFAYIASHDLKAPMRGIDNLAKWIAEDLQDVMNDEAQEKINMMRQRIARLETLLEDILSYSRAGRIIDKPEDVDTQNFVEEIIQSIALPDGFNVTIPQQLPDLRTVITPLQQIFLNLISNAYKHHDKDKGNIIISYEDRGKYYEFSVQDDGPGIPEEFQERVFEMFQTLQSRDKTEGTGLGMSIIKKLVEWQDGKVWIDSKNGERGTTVHFLWPKICKEEKG